VRAPRVDSARDAIGGRREGGAALLIALLTVLVVSAIGAVLISVAIVETTITGAHRYAAEASYAADAAFERALRDLDLLPDWSLALLPPPANVQSTFVDGQLYPSAPDGRQLDVMALTAARQAHSDAQSGPSVFGADSPQWRIYAHSSLAAILPPGTPVQPAYVLVWVSDDGEDGDGDPAIDSNSRIAVFAEAYGSGGARRAIEGSLGRSAQGTLAVLNWRHVH
jgi:hypothetical protein